MTGRLSIGLPAAWEHEISEANAGGFKFVAFKACPVCYNSMSWWVAVAAEAGRELYLHMKNMMEGRTGGMFYRKMLRVLPLLMMAGPAFGQVKPAWTEAQRPIAESVERYTAAFNKGDVAGLKDFFAEDARLVTVDGEVLEGRDAVLGLFAEGIQGNPGLKIANDVRSIRMVGDQAAIESGFSSTTTDTDKTPKTVAYHVVHVKRDDKWTMFDIMETEPARDPSQTAHLEKLAVLEPLVGEWVEETETATVRHVARWSPSHRYLLIDYVAATGDALPVVVSTQRVGWDPRSRSIRSWLFEEDGGHGTATWTPETGDRVWKLKGEAVLADGRVVSGTTLFDASAKEKIVIRGYDRSVDGQAVEDAPARTLVRKAALKPAGRR